MILYVYLVAGRTDLYDEALSSMVFFVSSVRTPNGVSDTSRHTMTCLYHGWFLWRIAAAAIAVQSCLSKRLVACSANADYKAFVCRERDPNADAGMS